MLVLFDIEGTLLDGSAQTHLHALADAVEKVTAQRPAFRYHQCQVWVGETLLNGLVDTQVVAVLLDSVGTYPHPTLVRKAMGLAPTFYRQALAAGLPAGQVLPGVVDLLQALTKAQVRCALATGNHLPIARAKLAAVGLGGVFIGGGFGGTAPDRVTVVRDALAWSTKNEPVWLVGDTPSDIVAAHTNGITVIAVQTGGFNVTDLEDADVIVPTLEHADIRKVFSLSTDPQPHSTST